MSNRSRRKQRADRIGILLLTAVAIVVVSLVYLIHRLNSSKVTMDSTTFCPQDGLRSITAVLLDTTDALDAVQRASVIQRLDSIKESMPRWGELELFSVAATGDQLLDVKLKVCNPGRAEDIDPLYGNRRLFSRKWQEPFSQKTDKEINELLKPHTADVSPILESIQQAALQGFGSGSENVPKSLTIVSDMLQNTPELSQYHGIEPFERFKETPYYLKVRADLSGVDVTILLLNRPQNGIGRRAQLMKFWEGYFNDAKVKTYHAFAIEG
ncbi:MAG: hypothetical protein ACREQT_13230 [Candidatus Binataceae bacterium]